MKSLLLGITLLSTSTVAVVAQEVAMAKEAHPGFLVATIKLSKPDAQSGGFPTEGHHITCYNETVADILGVAYGIHAKQVVNAPEWMSKTHYDVEGIPDVPGEPSLLQMREMYQKLLAERFHLTFHKEVRDLPIYAVTVAKGGAKLKLAEAGEPVNTGNRGSGTQRTLKFTNMSMGDFALNMNFYEERPVIDKTGLPGRYDFAVTWTYDESQAPVGDAPPSLFTALREQAGLKIDAVKGPAEVFVIDRVEPPSSN